MTFLNRWFGPPDIESAERRRDAKGLLKILRAHKSGPVRERAAGALGDIADAGSVDTLIASLAGDARLEVRAACATALGKIGDTRAVPALIDALDDIPSEDDWVVSTHEISAYSDARATARKTAKINWRVANAAEAAPLRRPPRSSPAFPVLADASVFGITGGDSLDLDQLERNRDVKRLIGVITAIRNQYDAARLLKKRRPGRMA